MASFITNRTRSKLTHAWGRPASICHRGDAMRYSRPRHCGRSRGRSLDGQFILLHFFYLVAPKVPFLHASLEDSFHAHNMTKPVFAPDGGEQFPGDLRGRRLRCVRSRWLCALCNRSGAISLKNLISALDHLSVTFRTAG